MLPGTVAVVVCLLAGIFSPAVSRAAQEPKETSKPLELGKYKPRYEGTRWALVYGSYEGVERFAVNEIQRTAQLCFPYVIEVHPAGAPRPAGTHLLLVGTAANHPMIAELGAKGLKLPNKAEGYTVACLKSPWDPALRVAVIAGADPNGVLYGVEEFNRRLADTPAEDARGRRQALDQMPDFEVNEAPVIENRGIWTWGYVLYDYRRFIDNMARLKMNRLMVWNDTPPLNCREVIEYAHSRGVKVILGFHWGWGIVNLDPTSRDHLRQLKELVVNNFESHYSQLGMDGIYFQSFTEHSNTRIGGRTTAALVCEWVNEIAGKLLERHPGLRIEFGVHATSIIDNYLDFQSLDARIPIVWEDAGAMPFGQSTSTGGSFPRVTLPEGRGPSSLSTVEGTTDYSKKLATFRRDNHEFAMIAKGFSLLRWNSEFEHHGPFILGERHPDFVQERLRERQPRLDYSNTRWAKEYRHAVRFFREVRGACTGPMTVVGLVEDGLFEQKIQVSVALLGEILWNPMRDESDFLPRAIRASRP
jgi:hypothetical protein